MCILSVHGKDAASSLHAQLQLEILCYSPPISASQNPIPKMLLTAPAPAPAPEEGSHIGIREALLQPKPGHNEEGAWSVPTPNSQLQPYPSPTLTSCLHLSQITFPFWFAGSITSGVFLVAGTTVCTTNYVLYSCHMLFLSKTKSYWQQLHLDLFVI